MITLGGSRTNIYTAIARVQAELKPLIKDKDNPFFKSKYADLGAVLDVLKEPLSNAGLLMLQSPYYEEDKIGVETLLVHLESGEELTYKLAVVNSATNPAQGAGIIITYLRRYSLMPIFSMYADDDDDANGLSKKEEPVISDTVKKLQAKAIKLAKELSETKKDEVLAQLSVTNPKTCLDETKLRGLIISLESLKS